MILIADDDQATLRLLGRVFQREGYQVMTARDGQEALTLAEQYQPEVVVSDIAMPRVNGMELARALRERPGDDRPKVVLMSAYVRPREDESDAFIPKPFDLPELVGTVGNLSHGEEHRVDRRSA